MAAGEFTVSTEIRIDASPEAVFPFLTEPDKIVLWKGVDAVVEAAPGGVYRVNVTGTKHAVGEYVEIDPPNRVVFTWGWIDDEQLPPGSSTVTIELVPGRRSDDRPTHPRRAADRGGRRAARGMEALPPAARDGRERRGSRSRPVGRDRDGRREHALTDPLP